MRSTHSALLFMSAALLAACERDAGPQANACPPDAVVSGRLPGEAVDARFEELWRSGSDAPHLATPLPLAVSADGRAAIADFQLGEVYVFEADGASSGAITKRGAGPGELASPVAVSWGSDDSLTVYDIAKPAIVKFGPDLAYVDESRSESPAAAAIFASGTLDWAGIQPSGALVFLPGLSAVQGRADGMEVAIRVSPGSVTADTLRVGFVPIVQTTNWMDAAVPGYSRVAASIGAGGRLAIIGGEPGWLVDVYGDDGARILRVCAEAPGQPLTEAERGAGPEEHVDLAAAFSAADPAPSPARHGRIVVGADGTLWVQRERRPPYPDRRMFFGDPGTTFDVFSSEGAYLRTLRLPERTRLQGALGDTIWAYEVDELDVLSLVAYRVIAEGQGADAS